ncbi:hypothetical protein QJS10_CPA08g00843 [Acorus calamus]|uniref:Uncharacterized protein n=1 Tax=Acorus calamus TaxID=4465 RepID=A0AAV9EDK9_ACOCL|nr:hypothetical protein QJS10_CPA08g00843 [Acorus calamus]
MRRGEPAVHGGLDGCDNRGNEERAPEGVSRPERGRVMTSIERQRRAEVARARDPNPGQTRVGRSPQRETQRGRSRDTGVTTGTNSQGSGNGRPRAIRFRNAGPQNPWTGNNGTPVPTAGLGTISSNGSGGRHLVPTKTPTGGRHNPGRTETHPRQPKPTWALEKPCLPIIPAELDCFELATLRPSILPPTPPYGGIPTRDYPGWEGARSGSPSGAHPGTRGSPPRRIPRAPGTGGAGATRTRGSAPGLLPGDVDDGFSWGGSRPWASTMILPQVHLRKPCYDFSFL